MSTLVYGSGDRLRRLREGKDMLSANIEDGLQWFSDRWPEGAVWPSEVPRPAPRPPTPVPSSAAPAAGPPA
ncbi:hypothetical protein [Methylobacterium frigidaeris]|uniref:hypothetical protein n=1 Tax=Methylobacterium frigidaeris TaxID=2038277 RepID=UPI001055B3A7|nr:hypothetical protein [Methylobacterium frigidaeris]